MGGWVGWSYLCWVCSLYRPSWGIVEKKAQRSWVKGRVCVCVFLSFISFLTVLGLRCCMQVLFNCGELLFVAVHGLFLAVVSLVAEHRLWGARELSSSSSRALLPRVMWNLTGAGIEPVSPALAGGFSLSMYNLFIFNWRIFPLHCCAGFHYTSTWISHRHTYVPSILNLHPTPLGCHREPGWAPCIIQRIPTGYLFYILWCVCFSATLSICPTPPVSPQVCSLCLFVSLLLPYR